jgi:hypothetical protein
MCSICNKEIDWSHILRCEKIMMWRDWVLHKRATNTDAEIGIWRIVGCTE